MRDPRTAPSKANGSFQRRLLIGESNPALRDYLLAVLRADGHEVVAMTNGIDLLDTLAVSLHPQSGSAGFDLVITDARMLGKAESEMFSELGNRAKAPPFVFTVSFREKELQARAVQFGALAVLDKPLDIDRLREIVNSSLHQPTGEQTGTPRVPQAEREQIPQSVWR